MNPPFESLLLKPLQFEVPAILKLRNLSISPKYSIHMFS